MFRPVLRDCRALLRKARNDKSGNLPRPGRGAGWKAGHLHSPAESHRGMGKVQEEAAAFSPHSENAAAPSPEKSGLGDRFCGSDLQIAVGIQLVVLEDIAGLDGLHQAQVVRVDDG